MSGEVVRLAQVMEIEEIGCRNPEVLHVKCAGEFGIGSGGNVSGALLTRAIRHWIAGHENEPVSEIELDFKRVTYEWGDGPVSAVEPFLRMESLNLGSLRARRTRRH